MPHATITFDLCRHLAAALGGPRFVPEHLFGGCNIYKDGACCGRPVVETLVPIYGDHVPNDQWVTNVCSIHLAQHLGAHFPMFYGPESAATPGGLAACWPPAVPAT